MASMIANFVVVAVKTSKGMKYEVREKASDAHSLLDSIRKDKKYGKDDVLVAGVWECDERRPTRTVTIVK